MTWKTGLGFGFILWTIMYAAVSAAVAWGVYGAVWAQVLVVIVAGGVASVFGTYARFGSIGSALAHSVAWVAIALALDYLVSYRFSAELFSSWTVWVGYLAILIAPLFAATSTSTLHAGQHRVAH